VQTSSGISLATQQSWPVCYGRDSSIEVRLDLKRIVILSGLKMTSKIMLACSLLLVWGIAAAQVATPKHFLAVDDILGCTSGFAEKLLGKSVDKIREADLSPVLKLDDGVVINWSMSGDHRPTHDVSEEGQHLIESSKEYGFCRTGVLKLLALPHAQRYLGLKTGSIFEGNVPSGGSSEKVIPLSESNLFVAEIIRFGDGYKFTPQQIYSGNHQFSQEKGVFRNSDQQFLYITLEPVQCDVTLSPVEGGANSHVLVTRSKIGLELQWKGKQDNWEFYRAIYTPLGCP